MSKIINVTVFTVSALCALLCMQVSGEVMVDTSVNHNRRWMTLSTNEVELVWDWPDNAVQASLLITGMHSTVTASFAPPTASYLWQVFQSDVPEAEDVYDLTLTFTDGTDAVAGALTSRLAVVRGAFDKAAVVTTPETAPWPSVKNDMVIPYDAGWDPLTSGTRQSRLAISKEGGPAQTFDAADSSGYFGWKIFRSPWGYGLFRLTLAFPDEAFAWQADVVRVQGGSQVYVK